MQCFGYLIVSLPHNFCAICDCTSVCQGIGGGDSVCQRISGSSVCIKELVIVIIVTLCQEIGSSSSDCVKELVILIVFCSRMQKYNNSS